MNRDELAHAIRAACTITSTRAIRIIGSQSILATWDFDELPAVATMSREVDILPLGENSGEAKHLSDLIEGVAGEMSPFHATHKFFLDGVDESTTILPPGWEGRLVEFSNSSTTDIVTGEQYTGWCLEPHDLCVAKLCAGRDKDRRFVNAVIAAGLVGADLVRQRLAALPAEYASHVARALTFIAD